MTQEEKDLLLKDLCVRLPYGVKLDCKWKTPAPNGTYGMICTMDSFLLDQICNIDDIDVPFDEVKPYLFPLSSMTEEQEEEFKNLYYRYHESAFIFNERFSYDRYSIKDIGFYPCYLQDWLNKHHFDYRGLIEKRLAIDATGLNIY